VLRLLLSWLQRNRRLLVALLLLWLLLRRCVLLVWRWRRRLLPPRMLRRMLLVLGMLLLLLLLLLRFGLLVFARLAALLAASARRGSAANAGLFQLRKQRRHRRIRLLLPLPELLVRWRALLLLLRRRGAAGGGGGFCLPLPHALPLLQSPQSVRRSCVTLLHGSLRRARATRHEKSQPTVCSLLMPQSLPAVAWQTACMLVSCAAGRPAGSLREAGTAYMAGACTGAHLHGVVLGLRVDMERVGPMQAKDCGGGQGSRRPSQCILDCHRRC
jgi:hypothetical protein